MASHTLQVQALTETIRAIDQKMMNLQIEIDGTMNLLRQLRSEINCIEVLLDLMDKISSDKSSELEENLKKMKEKLDVLNNRESIGYNLIDEFQIQINQQEKKKQELNNTINQIMANKENF